MGDWPFSLKRAVRAQNKDAYALMTRVESEKEEIDDEIDLSVEDTYLSAGLYDILCQFCKDEALTVLRNVEDCQGARAWQRLFKKYNPKTVARMIRLLGEVTAPPEITEYKGVESAVNNWEHKLDLLDKEFGERFSDPMKIAIMVNAMPRTIQDQIYTNLVEGAKYRDTINKIEVIAGNHAAMESPMPVPMDVGEVCKGCGHEAPGEEDDVGAVGMHVQCRTCGGWDHMQCECPSCHWERQGAQKEGGKGGGVVAHYGYSGNDSAK